MSTSIATEIYSKGFVTSKDGTTIGYRQMGHGAGVVLIHGGMQASQNFMKLAAALSDEFTVYVPDRRGRGMSGGYGNAYGVQRDVEDIEALLNQTGAHSLFGLSSGALISLQAALALPSIQKLALYEPPLSINGSTNPTWVTRFDREIAQGKTAAAMITALKGTVGNSDTFGRLPRFLTVPLMTLAAKAQTGEVKGDDVSIAALIPTMHYDAQIVMETADTLERYQAITADVLLLGGSKSPASLKLALDHLKAVLPHAQRIEFPGFDHLAAANDGHPEVVAEELRRFFHQPPTAI